MFLAVLLLLIGSISIMWILTDHRDNNVYIGRRTKEQPYYQIAEFFFRSKTKRIFKKRFLIFLIILYIWRKTKLFAVPITYFIISFFKMILVMKMDQSCSELMDSITNLYCEIILLCYLIVCLVLELLVRIFQFFSSFSDINYHKFIEALYYIKKYHKRTGIYLTNSIIQSSVKYNQKGIARLDLLFLVFPTSIIFYIVIPTLGFLYNRDLNMDSQASSFLVEITGNQWYWSYNYIIDWFDTDGDNIHFLKTKAGVEHSYDSIMLSDEELSEYNSDIFLETPGKRRALRLLDVDCPLVLPSHTIITLSFTSSDVIHSWSVPQLGIKVDTIPGRVTTSTIHFYIDNIYLFGQCSELCGAYHGFMPISILCVNREDFFNFVSTGEDFFNSTSSYFEYYKNI